MSTELERNKCQLKRGEQQTMKKLFTIFLILAVIVLFAQERELDNHQKTVFFSASESKSKKYAWKSIGPDGGDIKSMASNPQNSQEIYATVKNMVGVLFKSSNSGKTWKRLAEDIYGYGDIAIDPNNPDIIYILSRYYQAEIFKS